MVILVVLLLVHFQSFFDVAVITHDCLMAEKFCLAKNQLKISFCFARFIVQIDEGIVSRKLFPQNQL